MNVLRIETSDECTMSDEEWFEYLTTEVAKEAVLQYGNKVLLSARFQLADL